MNQGNQAAEKGPAWIRWTIRGYTELDEHFTYEDAIESLKTLKQEANGNGYVESFEITHAEIVIPGKTEQL